MIKIHWNKLNLELSNIGVNIVWNNEPMNKIKLELLASCINWSLEQIFVGTNEHWYKYFMEQIFEQIGFGTNILWN